MAANPVVPAPGLQLETQKSAEETVVRCNGKLTSATGDLLANTVRDLIPGTKRIVLDLTNLSYCDSSGLGRLVGIYVSAKRAGCELRLINLGQRIKDLLRLTNLAKIFEGHEELLGYTPD